MMATTEKRRIFTRKKALAIVLLMAAALLVTILARWHSNTHNDLSTTDGREKFLLELGWEIDPGSETCQSVIIPDSLDGVLEEYNKMQLSQGYDLSRHLGETCRQYTYLLTNYPDAGGTVFITIYVQGRDIIAGDIHTSSINGFMHGIKRDAN